MKIGIVTQPLFTNYGGLLQNFALQQVLRSLGHEPLTLDYEPGYGGWLFVRYTLGRLVGRLRGMKVKVFMPPYRKRKGLIKRFVRDNMAVSQPIHGRYPTDVVERYGLDAVIVGSDQVWRPRYNPTTLPDMFCEFAADGRVRRIAYAASFGTADWEYTPEQAAACGPLLAGFDAVSVREASGVELARRLGCSARQVIDPTLLLGREGFEPIVKPFGGKPSEPYLGAYILDPSEETTRRLEALATSLGLKSVLQFKAGEAGMGPGEWIDAIRSSAFFVCDSFHGTVFALLNHVPVVVMVNASRGADRFHSLLRPLGLVDVLVEEVPTQVPDAQFNWDDIDSRLATLRRESLAFLTAALG